MRQIYSIKYHFNKICDETGDITVKRVVEIAKKKCESRFNMKEIENEVHAVSIYKKKQRNENSNRHHKSSSTDTKDTFKQKCKHCGWQNHSSIDSRYKNLSCKTMKEAMLNESKCLPKATNKNDEVKMSTRTQWRLLMKGTIKSSNLLNQYSIKM